VLLTKIFASLASSACERRRRWWPGTSTGFTPPGIPPRLCCQLMGCGWGVGMRHAGAGARNLPLWALSVVGRPMSAVSASISVGPSVVGRGRGWSPVSATTSVPWLLMSNTRRPLSPIAAEARSPAAFTRASSWHSASRLPGVRGRACAFLLVPLRDTAWWDHEEGGSAGPS
jgi:hypothetical protein